MFCARLLCGLMCLGVIGCSESNNPGEATLENAATADGGAVIGRYDESTDPAVSLIDVGRGLAAMNDAAAQAGSAAAGAGGSGGGTPVGSSDPDAGSVATDPDGDPPTDEEVQGEPMTEPAGAGGAGGVGGSGGGNGGAGGGNAGAGGGNGGASGTGGLVGTVCDLLGGLLCPVGLLCVEGLCQEPND